MSKARVNGVDLNFRSLGAGAEQLILIHGLAANMAFWNLELLSSLACKYRLTTYDLRGHGYSGMPMDGYRPIDMAGDLLHLMDFLEIPQAHLAAHSFGGAVALHLAAERPDRVKSVTLIDSRLKALQPHQRLVDWPNWREIKREFEKLNLRVDEYEDDIGLALLEQVAAPEWKSTRERLAQEALFIPFGGWSSGDRAGKRFIRLMRETKSRRDFHGPDGLAPAQLRSISPPILGIYGANSRCMITCNRLREVWPNCRIRVVPDVGHYFPAIRPALLGKLITEFLDDLHANGHLALPSDHAAAIQDQDAADRDCLPQSRGWQLPIRGHDDAVETETANPKGQR